jgi:hypothetical protein
MTFFETIGVAAPAVVEETYTKPKGWELFDYLGALFQHKSYEGNPPQPFIVHRFLASDKDYAETAAGVQLVSSDPAIVYELWRSILPQGRMPRLTYVGPKKEPAAEGLALALMERSQLNRTQAEDAVLILQAVGKFYEACSAYGVDVEPELPTPKKKATRKKKT